jgi:hypothetical protein
MPVRDVCHEHGISAHTFERCRSNFGGLEVNEGGRRSDSRVNNASVSVLMLGIAGEVVFEYRHRSAELFWRSVGVASSKDRSSTQV